MRKKIQTNIFVWDLHYFLCSQYGFLVHEILTELALHIHTFYNVLTINLEQVSVVLYWPEEQIIETVFIVYISKKYMYLNEWAVKETRISLENDVNHFQDSS